MNLLFFRLLDKVGPFQDFFRCSHAKTSEKKLQKKQTVLIYTDL